MPKLSQRKKVIVGKKKSLKKKKTLNKRTNAKKVKKSLKRKQQAGAFMGFLWRTEKNKMQTPENEIKAGDVINKDDHKRLVLLSPGIERENRLFPSIGQMVIVRENDCYVYAEVNDFGSKDVIGIHDEWRVGVLKKSEVPKDIGLNKIYILIPNEMEIVISKINNIKEEINNQIIFYNQEEVALSEKKKITREELKQLVLKSPKWETKKCMINILEYCLADFTPPKEKLLEEYNESKKLPISLLNFQTYWRVKEGPQIETYPKISQLVFFIEGEELKSGTLVDYSINEDEVRVTLQLSESQAPDHKPVLKQVNLNNIYIYFPEMIEIVTQLMSVKQKMEAFVKLIQDKGINKDNREIIECIQKYCLFRW